MGWRDVRSKEKGRPLVQLAPLHSRIAAFVDSVA
jgi:hypothetical protein